jgi:hypothetical protein
MTLVAKILKIISILFLSVIILLFAASLLMQNKVAGIVLKSLNNNFSTKIETGSYRLSLIKKFPRASVELKNVIVYSSPDFDRSGFGMINTDTLLTAKSASIDLKMIDMLKGAYTFTKINVRSGNLNLFTDTSGKYNYDISGVADDKGSSDNVNLNFNRINMSDIRFVYNDLRASLIIKGRFKNGLIKSKIKNDNIDFDGKSDVIFELFQLGNISVKQSIPADLDVVLSQNKKGLFFRKSTLGIENWDFILTGFIAADNYQDLKVTAQNIDISRVTNLFPEKYRKIISDYHPSGNLKFEWKIKGKPTKNEDPHYEITWSMKNARIENEKSKLKIDRFSFDGSFSNGIKNRPETSVFNISNFTTRLGSADYTGSFSVSNFSNPKAELMVKGKLYPAELKEFLNLRNVSRAAGSIDFDLKFSGHPAKKKTYKFTDVFDLNSQSEVTFNSAGITLDNKQIDIRDVSGKFLIRETTSTENFRFTINKQKITLSGKFMNLPGWLTGNPVNLSGSATVSASSVRPEYFMNSTEGTKPKGEVVTERATVTFPDNVNLDVNYNIDTLIYKTFDARKISGTLSIRPKTLNFRTITLNSQKGRISGNGVVVQNRNRSFIGRGSFAISGVDIREAFTGFNNFGQDFLKAENIAGSISGSVSLLLPMDSLLNPDIKSITAEGKYILTDGALINFDPVRALSRFIELSELENIKFDKLENDFFIRNNVLYLPTMEIKSSAVDLSVNGKHDFDNNYQYHVKLLLSEILSNKARKNRSVSDEFGEVEDDGLGRTSVFLKIDGAGEEVKVSYDMKAARNQIREDVKKEKETLKTIFNEEYGLYKGDPEQEKKQSSRKKFRITWEGSDTSVVDTNPPDEKKESIIKRIFKKK